MYLTFKLQHDFRISLYTGGKTGNYDPFWPDMLVVC